MFSVCYRLSGCQAAKSRRWAQGRSQGYCTEPCSTGASDTPEEEGQSMGIYHRLGSRARGTNIFQPTSLLVGGRMLRSPIWSVLRMNNS